MPYLSNEPNLLFGKMENITIELIIVISLKILSQRPFYKSLEKIMIKFEFDTFQ